MTGAPDRSIAILVVDSDIEDAEQTRQSFELAGLPARVDVAASGEEALMRLRRIGAYANAVRPDVVLASFALPGMSGNDLLREIRSDADSKKLPVIMFAGRASAETRETAARLGADHILDKPEHESEMLGVVAAIKFFWMARAAQSDAPPGAHAQSMRPKRMDDVDLMTLPLQPREAYLLSMIDGERGVTALSDMVGADPRETRAMLKHLAELGAVQWQPLHASLMPSKSAAAASVRGVRAAVARGVAGGGGGAGGGGRSSSAAPYIPRSPFSLVPGKDLAALPSLSDLPPLDLESLVPPAAPAASSTSTDRAPTPAGARTSAKPELDTGSRLVIDQTFELLGDGNHYELLGIGTDASKADIRVAYYRLAKLFHPDTRYTWDLGPHQRKMERIFQAVTDAYAVLGKAKSRAAYDAYLGIVVRTAPLERALSMPAMRAVEPRGESRSDRARDAERAAAALAEATTDPAAPAVQPSPEAADKAPRRSAPHVAPVPETPEPPSAQVESTPASTPRATTSRADGPHAETPHAAKTEPRPGEPVRVEGAVKALARTLNQLSARTQGSDRAARLIADAKIAERDGNLGGAAAAMRIASQWRPDDLELARDAERLTKEALRGSAAEYEQRAQYEEKHAMWKEAALSWSRVAKARPEDPVPARHAAAMIVQSGGDMREAVSLARRASELDPKCVETRIVLSDAFVASGMTASAKRHLTEALALDPRHPVVKAKLAALR